MLNIPFGFVVWPPAGLPQLPSACQSLPARPASQQPCAAAVPAQPLRGTEKPSQAAIVPSTKTCQAQQLSLLRPRLQN